MNGIASNVAAALIVPLLFYFGGALANKYAPQEVGLEFELSEHVAGDTRAYIIRLINRTEFEMEKINLDLPTEGLLVSNFSDGKKENGSAAISSGFWNGSLIKNEVISAILVYKTENSIINNNNFSERVSAQFSDRDAGTGKIVSSNAAIVPFGNWPRIEKIIYFGLYALPSIIFISLFFVGKIILGRRQQQGDSPQPPSG